MFCSRHTLTCVTEVSPQTSQGGVTLSAHAMYYLPIIWDILSSDAHLGFRCQKRNSDFLRKNSLRIISWP